MAGRKRSTGWFAGRRSYVLATGAFLAVWLALAVPAPSSSRPDWPGMYPKCWDGGDRYVMQIPPRDDLEHRYFMAVGTFIYCVTDRLYRFHTSRHNCLQQETKTYPSDRIVVHICEN